MQPKSCSLTPVIVTINQLAKIDGSRLRINPSFHGAWFNMGNNALGLDQFNKALKNYTNELKEYPRAEVYEKIAVTHANLYESEKAMENVVEALKLDSLYAPAYFLLGRIYR